jgi:hypothetical protein
MQHLHHTHLKQHSLKEQKDILDICLERLQKYGVMYVEGLPASEILIQEVEYLIIGKQTAHKQAHTETQ